jgi:hypothetical protein
MNEARLTHYLDAMVEPAFENFKRTGGVSEAYLACVAIFHAVDRATWPEKPGNLRREWGKESLPFTLIDVIAHHFKHVESNAETHPRGPGIPIAHALGFGPNGLNLERRNLYFVLRDAIGFLRTKAQARAATK